MKQRNVCSEGRHVSKFSKDFLTGCGTLILIGVLVFIVLPLILLGFKLALWLAVPVITLLVIVAGVAMFGRLINSIRKNWR